MRSPSSAREQHDVGPASRTEAPRYSAMNRISSVESPARKRRARKRCDGSADAARAETRVLRKADLLPVTGFNCKIDLAVLWRNPHPCASRRG
jgi:hypothetical protein